MAILGRRHLGICHVLICSLVACGDDASDAGGLEEMSALEEQPEAGDRTEGRHESGYTTMNVEKGGAIRGIVNFSGAVPETRTIVVTDDTNACGGSVQIHDLEIASHGGLANAVVSLTDITSGAVLEAPTSPAALDQRGCRFTPHVVLAGVDQVVEILNSDPVAHNVHTVAFDNRSFNRTQPPSVEKIEVSFPIAEKVRARCDIHGWMSAWIVVVDHPYNAVTDSNGGFAIGNIPDGTYTLEIWHETLGATTQTITVTPGQVTDLSIEVAQTSP